MVAAKLANLNDGQREEDMKPAPDVKGRAWTAEDDERLKSLIVASVSIDLVAAKMKRTIQAIKWRANARGVSIKRVRVGLKAKK
jgi:hypothetical protein